jgi:ferrochelatase
MTRVSNKNCFKNRRTAGGGEYAYIPALNSDQAHIDLLASLVQANLDALTHTLAHR